MTFGCSPNADCASCPIGGVDRCKGADLSPLLRFLGGIAARLGRHVPHKPSFLREVERRIEDGLERGEVRIDAVARELGYSRQTLYRRLKAEGSSFESILQDTRRRLAMKLLKEGKLSIKAIAYRLGFSDPAAFSRAFRRWTGQPPVSFRSG